MSNALAEKLSALVKFQLPDFVRDNYETFQSFLIAYYEFLEQDTEAQYNIQKAKSFADIDETLDSFVDYFLKQYAYNLPSSIFTNQENQSEGLTNDVLDSKRALAKYLMKFHSHKGSEGAVKLLFRLLFDDEITFYYPKEDIFKPSDGTWTKAQTIHLYDDFETDYTQYGAYLIEGATSGATAVLNEEFSLKKFPNANNIHEMSIEPATVTGNFLIDEYVYLKSANATTGNLEIIKTANTLPAISNVTIVEGGTGYLAGDAIYDGSHFLGSVSKVSTIGKIKEVSIAAPLKTTAPLYNANSVVSITVNAPSKTFSGKFDATGNVATIVLLDDTGNSITHGLTINDTVNVEFTSGIVANANLFTVKSILSSKRFTLANNRISTGTGNIVLRTLTANLVPTLGLITNYAGSYSDLGSHTNSIKKLQDSDYYQEYSYVIRSTKSSRYWADIIRKTLHPAGMKLFSEVYFTIGNAFTSVSVLPDNGLYQTFITFLKLIIEAPQLPAIQPSQIMNIESLGRIDRGTRYRIGPTYRTLENFKYDYNNLKIYDVGDLTLEFLSSNIDQPISFAPPDEIYQGNANVVLNSTFNTTSDWSLGTGFAISSGNLVGTSATANASQSFTSVGNVKVMATYEVKSVSAGSIRLMANTRLGESVFAGTSRTSEGNYSEIFFVNAPIGNVILNASGFTGNVDNVFVKVLETITY